MLHLPHARSVESFVTVSGGVALLHRADDGSLASLIKAADESLFEAKHSGRNKVICLGASPFE